MTPTDITWIHRYFDEVNDLMVVVDMASGAILEANRRGCQNIGLVAEEVFGRPISEFVHPDDQEKFGSIVRELVRGESLIVHQRWRDGNGDWVPFQVYVQLADAHRLLVCARNESQIRDTGTQLARLSTLVDLTDDLLLVSTPLGRVEWVNHAADRLLGTPEKGWIGRSMFDFLADEDSVGPLASLREAMDRPDHRASARVQAVDRDGNPVDLWASTVYDADSGLFYSVVRNVTDLRRAESRMVELNAQLSEQALTDSVTNLANRRAFVQAVDAAVESPASVAVVLIDLDRFKVINDSLGHAVGDALLVEVAKRLCGSDLGVEKIARFGGDEFAVLIRVGTDEEVSARAETIRGVLRHHYMIEGRVVNSSASLGAAISTRGDKTIDLLRKADLALYEAKRRGRDRIALFDEELQQRIDTRFTTETRLRAALDRGLIGAHAQAIVSAATPKIQSFELLARLLDGTRGCLGPDEFIPVAEEAGLLDAITLAVVQNACETFGTSADGWVRDMPTLAINVAPSQLVAGDFADRLIEEIDRSGGSNLKFAVEITETGLTDAVRAGTATLDRLVSCGFDLMIDDFGKGASALSYLRDLPLAGVKIDSSFVQNIESDNFARTITRSVIELATELKLVSVAEGVETRAQQEALQAMGCDWLQGWLFDVAQPLSVRVRDPQRLHSLAPTLRER